MTSQWPTITVTIATAQQVNVTHAAGRRALGELTKLLHRASLWRRLRGDGTVQQVPMRQSAPLEHP
jgi:hypothetical protein